MKKSNSIREFEKAIQKSSALFFLILAVVVPDAQSAWSIKKTEWSAQDEKGFSAFVQNMGRSSCNTVQNCFRSEANIYYQQELSNSHVFKSDCADLPVVMRAYYAARNQLPFSAVVDVASLDRRGSDIRYTINGNMPTRRAVFSTQSADEKVNLYSSLRYLSDYVSSSHYRMDPRKQYDVDQDYYSPTISPQTIKPGTVIYDPSGHVAVVYDIAANGDILFIDTHPDQTMSRGVYSAEKFTRSRPEQGGQFKNWRPFKVTGAKLSSDGFYYGGNYAFVKNEQILDVSFEQYLGAGADVNADWQKASYLYQGAAVKFFEWLKLTLSQDHRIHVLQEFSNSLDNICADFKGRVQAVDEALVKGVDKKSHPARLPRNIWGAAGEWEDFSSPGRDTRLRFTASSLVEVVGYYNYQVQVRNRFFDYTGSNLKNDFLAIYNRASQNCSVTYKNSIGQNVTVTYDDLLSRLSQISFDPYHCVELRWGASQREELSTCRADQDKMSWYKAQIGLRQMTQRDTLAKMDLSLSELQQDPYKLGVREKPDFNIKAAIQQLQF